MGGEHLSWVSALKLLLSSTQADMYRTGDYPKELTSLRFRPQQNLFSIVQCVLRGIADLNIKWQSHSQLNARCYFGNLLKVSLCNNYQENICIVNLNHAKSEGLAQWCYSPTHTHCLSISILDDLQSKIHKSITFKTGQWARKYHHRSDRTGNERCMVTS